MSKPVPGQRWISESEPDLGLGTLLSHAYGRAEILFSATGEVRQYAVASAPLRRVAFQVGDRLPLFDGTTVEVTGLREDHGLLVYLCGEREVDEAEIIDTMSFNAPGERLIAGRVSDYHLFRLRTQALRQRARIASSPVRGLVGARIDLIPHQIAIADEVARRWRPRVLLADEVGLGKTIEACLILQRLRLTGRANRILILLPEPLIHQWFVELLRRFNLLAAIFDEERCASLTDHDPEANPFLDSQVVLCATDFLAENAERAAQVCAAPWDLLIVDEAHHLEWRPEQSSAAYQLVEQLASTTEAVLLITATPQQLGPEGHFARLRLLDPERYPNLEQFLAESDRYEALTALIDSLKSGKTPTAKTLNPFVSHSPHLQELAKSLKTSEQAREELILALLDSFGTGRVLFRNTRQALKGFPERRVHLHPVACNDESAPSDAKFAELVKLLDQLGQTKVLLICKSKEMVAQLAEALPHQTARALAQFHEDLTLLQRDRNAAYFSEPNGASLLLCSEIGSEGRNFQFAQHLVLYDLPSDPDLVEQRIGRLDRIGQVGPIHLHLPYLLGTREEVLVRWFHEGLGIFEENRHGANEAARRLTTEMQSALSAPNAKNTDKLIQKTQKIMGEIGERLSRGYDRLLEWNSAKPGRAAEQIARIQDCDADLNFEDFFLRLMDACHLKVEDLDDRRYLIKGGEQVAQNLPELPEDGITLTFERQQALSREDSHFGSIDHPMVQGGIDALLSSERGNACFSVWETPGEKTLYLEGHAVIEAIAPASLHLDRFFPPTPVRLVIDHGLKNQSANEELAQAKCRGGNLHQLLGTAGLKEQMLPKMLRRLDELFLKVTEQLIQRARQQAEPVLQAELDRLRTLAELNDHISAEEIEALSQQRDAILDALSKARPRLDAVRLIFKRPQTAGRLAR